MNVFNNIISMAKRHPNKLAFSSNTERISYKSLYENLLKFQVVHSSLYKKDDVVLLDYKDPVTFSICFLGLLSMQCWVVLLPKDSEPSIKEKLCYQKNQCFSFDEWTNNESVDLNFEGLKLNLPNEDQCGIYHATSGSVLAPKLCIRSLRALTNEGFQYQNTLTITPGDRICSISPFYHSYPLGAALMASLVSGASLWITNGFVPRTCLEFIKTNKITILILVPQIAQYLCDITYKEKIEGLCLRIVLAGAGKITKELYKNFKQSFGIFLSSNYGSTETGGLLTRNFEDDEISNGFPMPGVKIKICDQNGVRIPPGNEGIVYVKSDSMLSDYFPSQNNIFDNEGFFSMNDIAIELPGSKYILIDRNKNIVNIAGKKINIKEVEQVISSHEKVEQCLIFVLEESGVPKGLIAYIQCDQDINKELRIYCSKYLSDYKIPQRMWFLKEFFKNEMGKITLTSLKNKN
jgi:acyl-CoA synthetase (AMP-forming)/AMP-acid ligase II